MSSESKYLQKYLSFLNILFIKGKKRESVRLMCLLASLRQHRHQYRQIVILCAYDAVRVSRF